MRGRGCRGQGIGLRFIRNYNLNPDVLEFYVFVTKPKKEYLRNPALKHCIHCKHLLNRGALLSSRLPDKRVKNWGWNIVEIHDCLLLLVIISTCHCCCLILSSYILSSREQASRIPGNKTVLQHPPSRAEPAT